MKYATIQTILLAGLLLGLALPAWADEAQLLQVLQSNASRKEKADACRELVRQATAKSVPVLAGLLSDPEMSHMARYALEPIPDPAVEDALRAALEKTKGLRLVGVIGSLGVRRDAKAVPPIAGLLKSPEADVASAAARALGSIGTPEAAKALQAALAASPAANQVSVCEGLLRAAERLLAAKDAPAAVAIYDQLRALTPATQPIRTAALRGAILARGKEGLPILVQAVRGDDWILVVAAVRASMEMQGTDVAAALAGELAKARPDKQILLAHTLGCRGDAAAAEPLMTLAGKASPPAVRAEAVKALTQLGHAGAVPMLVELAQGEDQELAGLARQSLAGFPGKEGDAAIASLLSSKDTKSRALAIELLVQRRASGAVEVLLKGAQDADADVRVACARALRDLATLKDMPALINLLLAAKADTESQAAESALAALCARNTGPATGNVKVVKAVYGALPGGPLANVTKKVAKMVQEGAASIEASNGAFGDTAPGKVKAFRIDYTVNGVPVSKTVREGETVTLAAVAPNPACVDALVDALGKAAGPAKVALLRTLRSAPAPKALQAVQAAASEQGEAKETALRVLCEWPSADALPAVSGLAKSSQDKAIKILALRAMFRLIPQQEAPAADKLEALKGAMALAERDDEKRLALAALGSVPTEGALSLIAPHLDSDKLKEEAAIAAVAVAEQVAPSALVAQVMEKAAKSTSDTQLAAKARQLAKRK